MADWLPEKTWARQTAELPPMPVMMRIPDEVLTKQNLPGLWTSFATRQKPRWRSRSPHQAIRTFCPRPRSDLACVSSGFLFSFQQSASFAGGTNTLLQPLVAARFVPDWLACKSLMARQPSGTQPTTGTSCPGLSRDRTARSARTLHLVTRVVADPLLRRSRAPCLACASAHAHVP